MSKKGRQRRTPERMIADRENRSTFMYLQRLQREVEQEKLDQLVTETTEAQ